MKKILLPLISSVLFASNLDTAVLNIAEKNYNQAIQLLKQEKKKTKQVEFLLGQAYFERHLTYTDYKFALEHFKKAGTKKSLWYLGKMYENGLGVKRDIHTAINYFKKANTKESNFELAKIYLNGKYLLKNPKLGFQLLEKSAKAGYAKAQLLLGKFYLTNNSLVDKDLTQAAKWLYLSNHNGNLEAKQLWNKYKLYRYLQQ